MARGPVPQPHRCMFVHLGSMWAVLKAQSLSICRASQPSCKVVTGPDWVMVDFSNKTRTTSPVKVGCCFRWYRQGDWEIEVLSTCYKPGLPLQLFYGSIYSQSYTTSLSKPFQALRMYNALSPPAEETEGPKRGYWHVRQTELTKPDGFGWLRLYFHSYGIESGFTCETGGFWLARQE